MDGEAVNLRFELFLSKFTGPLLYLHVILAARADKPRAMRRARGRDIIDRLWVQLF